jgi:hypothetical protein
MDQVDYGILLYRKSWDVFHEVTELRWRASSHLMGCASGALGGMFGSAELAVFCGEGSEGMIVFRAGRFFGGLFTVIRRECFHFLILRLK